MELFQARSSNQWRERASKTLPTDRWWWWLRWQFDHKLKENMLITISIKLTQIVVLGIPVPVPVPFCEVFIIFTLFFLKLGIIPIIVTILRDFWNHFKILVSARVPHLLPIFYTLHPCSLSSLNFSALFPWVFFSWYFPESYIGDIFRFQYRWLSMLAEDRAQAVQIWRFS